ncbi:MAG: hypothetical protein ACXIUM_12150 [Wenzhouxiangella sp.]
MNFIGSIFSNAVSQALVNVVGAALGGPAGMAISQIVGRAFLSDVMHNMIDSLPLPPFAKHMLHNTVTNSLGSFPPGTGFQAFNEFVDQLSSSGVAATQIAALQRDVNGLQEAVDGLSNFILSTQRNNSHDGSGRSLGEHVGGGEFIGGLGGAGATGRGGWIRELAEVLGEILDEIAAEMDNLARNMDKEDPSTVALFTAESQAFGIMMNGASTALKSVGEGMTAQARKQ